MDSPREKSGDLNRLLHQVLPYPLDQFTFIYQAKHPSLGGMVVSNDLLCKLKNFDPVISETDHCAGFNLDTRVLKCFTVRALSKVQTPESPIPYFHLNAKYKHGVSFALRRPCVNPEFIKYKSPADPL
jgi:hypothetical protein